MNIDQFMAWHASVLPSGDVVRCDRRGNVATSEIARARLRFIVRADRTTAQDGRWVLQRLRGPIFWAATLAGLVFTGRSKPRYRWEVRR